MDETELVLKVLVLGDQATGKTSIIRRTISNDFSELHQPTIGVDFHFKSFDQNGRQGVLQLWDIAGQDRFGAIYRVYYRDAYGALIIFDLSRPDTLEGAIKWKRELDSKVQLPNGKPLPAILLGNKSDLDEAKVNSSELDKFCSEHNFAGWLDTSAKMNHNIEQSIERLVSHILEHDDAFDAQRQAAAASRNDSDINFKPPPKSGSCC